MHQVEYNARTGIVEITAKGTLTFRDLNSILLETLPLVEQHNAQLLLGDFREAIVNISTVDIYELPKVIQELSRTAGERLLNLKRAVVLSEHTEDFKFYETVFVNRGKQTARLFHDLDEARRWLSEKQDATSSN